MAELGADAGSQGAMRPIPAREQLRAVAWLRWRIFLNTTFLRPRTKQQAMGLVFGILLRMIVWPVFALMVIGPVAASGLFAWQAIARKHPQNIALLLTGITLLWQFVSFNGMNLAATTSSFDPSSLMRYPLRFGRYMILRTMFGLLTPSTIVGTLTLLAAVVGIGIAKPDLVLCAAVVLAVYALMNIFLTRAIEAWMERWLANRRFREAFGVLMALAAVGLQVLNIQRSSFHGGGASHRLLFRLLHEPGPILSWLPPGFAANAILVNRRPGMALLDFAGLLASTGVFAAAFGIRLHKQFLGEYLGEGQSRATAERGATRRKKAGPEETRPAVQEGTPGTPPLVIGACLRKEWLMLRGNSTQLIGLLMPLVFIVILGKTTFAQRPAYFLPGAIAYALGVGVLAGLYNIFGADGPGVQVYLLAPARLLDVVAAKNLASLALVLFEVGGAWLLVSILTHGAIPPAAQVSTGLWTCFVIGTNLALGTLRSIQAPRRFIPGVAQQRRGTPTGRTSGLLMFVVLFGSMGLQIPVVLLSRYLNEPWLGSAIFGPFAAASVVAYALVLLNAEKLVMAHRDVFADELCKA